jgi:CheY-like chemotaxis protein
MNKLFLIDDDEDDHLFFKDALKAINPKLDFEIATNGKIALDQLKASKILPDLIFLDLNMPIMNGFDFLVQIRKDDRLNKIPIGIFSTSSVVRDKELTKDLGARFYITKPSDFKTLCIKIRKILESDFNSEEYIAIT